MKATSDVRLGLRQAGFKSNLEENKEPWQGSEQGSVLTCILEGCVWLPQAECRPEPGTTRVVLGVKKRGLDPAGARGRGEVRVMGTARSAIPGSLAWKLGGCCTRRGLGCRGKWGQTSHLVVTCSL